MELLRKLLTLSRPRFWIYLLGPYLLGSFAAGIWHDHLPFEFIFFFLYFTFPANLLIYGVNDLFDWETDKHNPKKQTYEALLAPGEREKVVWAILLTNVPFLLWGFMLGFPETSFWLAAFLFLGIFYSATPIRAKARPVVDSLFNGLYIMPGLFSYGLFSLSVVPTLIIIAGWLWSMAMHAYSAVPDIDADQKAKVSTIATWMGVVPTLVVCALLYGTSAVLVSVVLPYGWAWVLGGVYVGMMLLTIFWTKKQRDTFRLYTLFPWINTLSGFVLFVLIVLNRF
jgi:lycopene elongase/hydratase (dihydrobisanhydrobacterioruberin-forming)